MRQVLRILLSSEEDAQFLHMLEVSEEEFQGLKAEQGILVDFGSFPGKVVSLLQKCAAERAAQPPRCRGRAPAPCADAPVCRFSQPSQRTCVCHRRSERAHAQGHVVLTARGAT